jgi:hypothetical protein
MTPGREANEWVVIKLSEPRRKQRFTRWVRGRGRDDDTTLQSEKGKLRGRGSMGSTDGRRVCCRGLTDNKVYKKIRGSGEGEAQNIRTLME